MLYSYLVLVEIIKSKNQNNGLKLPDFFSFDIISLSFNLVLTWNDFYDE